MFLFNITNPSLVKKRGGWGARSHREKLKEGDSNSLTHAIQTYNAQALTTAHAPLSLKSYNSGWRSWLRCAHTFQFDPYCRDTVGSYLSIECCVDLLKTYLGCECGLRQISPKTIKNVYLPGIADTLDRMGIFSKFREAKNHSIFTVLLGGYLNGYAKHHPHCGAVKIPFDGSMATEAEVLLSNGQITFPRFPAAGPSARARMELCRLISALFLGIFFLLRKGEFLPTDQAPNHIAFKRENLRFYDSTKQVIPYGKVGYVKAASLSITIVFSKADQSGKGRITHHMANFARPRDCVVHRLQEYIAASRNLYNAKAHDRLFDIPTFAILTTTILTSLMRKVCGSMGLPEGQVSAHSLRYGGAYMLAMMGFPEYIIAFYGGWAPGSSAMRRYIQISPEIISKVSHHMTMCVSSTSVQVLVRHLLANRVPSSLQPSKTHREGTILRK